MNLLIGPASLDIYVDQDLVLPGGGCVNIAWHWGQLGFPFSLLTRIGTDQTAVFHDFFARHRLPVVAEGLVHSGRSAAIDISQRPDGQVWMDNFVPGVWSDFRLTAAEERLLSGSRLAHLVLVEPVIGELTRLGRSGALLPGRRPLISADFLDFRHLTPVRMTGLLEWIDLGFVGWPGSRDDPELLAILSLAHQQQRLLIFTLGSSGIIVADGRKGRGVTRFFPVEPLPVLGTSVGCGDAFAAHFLAAFWAGRSVEEAVKAGSEAGAAATAWPFPLPKTAYFGEQHDHF